MIVFGWIVLTLIALYISCASVFMVLATRYFSGETPKLPYLLFGMLVNGLLWWSVVDNFPFIVGVA